MIAAVLVVIVVVGGRLGLDDLVRASVSREEVETGGERAMLSSGAGVAHVTCPGDLERETGATIVCTYTDIIAEAAAASVLFVDPGGPKTGRVEIRITGFHTTSTLGSASTSEPLFATRVIQKPPR
jgi:hypothetical protein